MSSIRPDFLAESALLEEFTKEYFDYDLNSHVAHYPDKSLPNGITRAELLRRCVTENSMGEVWRRCTTIFPDQAARGQIELWRAIMTSFALQKINYMTEKQSEEWSQEFSQTLEKAIKLWDDRPANIYADWEILEEVSKFIYGQGVLESSEDLLRLQTPGDELLSYWTTTGEPLKMYAQAVRRAQYVSFGHSKQVSGIKADRTYFIRQLSSKLKGMTGEWKRDSVARITSVIFQCNFTASEVTRAMKGWDRYWRPSFHDLSNEDWMEFIVPIMKNE